MGKILVEGRDAAGVLDRLCTADIDVPVGRIVHTLWLNEAGGIEADVTVARWSDARFLITTGSASVSRDLAWLRRHVPDDARCHVTDVTGAWAVIGLAGPRAREALAAATHDRLDDVAFPTAAAKPIELGYVPAWAHRLSYTGELGWELWVPVEMARCAFDLLMQPGMVRPIGFLALDSLRLEKGFRHFGHDIGSDDDPFAAGLGAAVHLEKASGFIGREALLRRRTDPISRRLLQFALMDPQPLLYGDEPILRDGVIVGRLSSGAYAHSRDHAIGMGWADVGQAIDRAWIDSGTWQIEIAGQRFPASASLDDLADQSGD